MTKEAAIHLLQSAGIIPEHIRGNYPITRSLSGSRPSGVANMLQIIPSAASRTEAILRRGLARQEDIESLLAVG